MSLTKNRWQTLILCRATCRLHSRTWSVALWKPEFPETELKLIAARHKKNFSCFTEVCFRNPYLMVSVGMNLSSTSTASIFSHLPATLLFWRISCKSSCCSPLVWRCQGCSFCLLSTDTVAQKSDEEKIWYTHCRRSLVLKNPNSWKEWRCRLSRRWTSDA